MRNVLVVLNAGGRSVRPKSRQSFRAAAKRWGFEYLELKELGGPRCPYWKKTLIPGELAGRGYDRAIQIDGDLLIRSDCPNPLDLVPGDSIGVVSAYQTTIRGRIEAREKAIAQWARWTGLKPCRDERHLNAGLIVYNCRDGRQLELFGRWQTIGRRHRWRPRPLPEQATLSLLLHNQNTVPVVWLPHAFNMVDSQDTRRPSTIGPAMAGFIYHFTGPNKSKRIGRTWWNHRGPRPPVEDRTRAILNRIPDSRPIVGVELGVMKARNAAALLDRRPNLFLYLVDLWTEHPAEGSYRESGDKNAEWNNEDWRSIFAEALARLAPYHGRFRILQSDTAEAAALFSSILDRRARDVVDFVFVDADHSAAGVERDLRAWLPRIRAGGWIGGHDYRHIGWGVREAVLKVAGEFKIDLVTDGGDTWFALAYGGLWPDRTGSACIYLGTRINTSQAECKKARETQVYTCDTYGKATETEEIRNVPCCLNCRSRTTVPRWMECLAIQSRPE